MKKNFLSILLIGLMAAGILFVPEKAQAATVHLNNSIAKPYYLNQAGATYILDEDISAEGTALVIDADNITVDLNGHTITFGANSVAIPNADFEQGSGTVPSNWDLSKAPSAKRVTTATQPMVHSWTLEMTNTAPEEIISDWTTITKLDQTYRAYAITTSNVTFQVEYENGSFIPLVDGAFFKPSINPGFGAGRYRLHITVPVVAGGTYIDDADIRASRAEGILGQAWLQGLGGMNPPDIPTAPGVHSFTTIKNGSIVEGAPGFGYLAFSSSGTGLDAYGIHAVTTGIDSGSAYAFGSNAKIHDSNLENNKPTVINRYDLSSNFGIEAGQNFTFYNNNFVIGAGGISFLSDTTSADIYNNHIINNGNVTNHFAIEVFANDGHVNSGKKIHHNTFEGGSGVFLSSNSVNNEIYNNYFNLTASSCNTEYETELHTDAIRVYDYSNPTASTYNNKIHDNLIVGNVHAYSDHPNCLPGIVGIKSVTGPNSPNEYYNNEVHVYREDTNSLAIAFTAAGQSLSGIHDNYLESNHHNIIYGDHFASASDNGIFTNNTFVKKTAPISTDYHTLDTEWCCGASVTTTHHKYIGSKQANGASVGDLNISMWSQKNYEEDIQWFLNLKVLDSGRNPVSGASVNIVDKNGTTAFTGTTDASGKINAITLRQYVRSGIINGPNSTSNYVYSTPHQITISKAGLPTETKPITMDNNKETIFILDGQANEPAIIINPAVTLNRIDKTATVTWTTDKPTSSTLKWGLDTNYGQTLNNSSLTTSHTMTIANISPNNYHFEVSGTDSSGLSSQSFDQTFFYLSDVPSGIKLIKSVDKVSASSGDILTYTINYTNTLTNVLNAVRIEDLIPNGTTFISASAPGSLTGTKVIWNLGDVAANGSGTVTFQVRMQ